MTVSCSRRSTSRWSGADRRREIVSVDAMTLKAECASPPAGLAEAVVETLQSVTKLKGAVAFVAPGSLPNDGKVISDERPVG